MTTPTQQPKIPTPNNIQECLTIQAHFIGIPKITKKNYVEFYERGKALQLLGVGWVTKEVDSTMEENQGRMPNLDEVEANIGIVESNAPRFDKKQWKDSLYQMIQLATTELIAREEQSLNEKEEESNERDKTITDD